MLSDVVIQVESISKQYRLGQIGGTTLREDLQRWWARVRQQPDPTLKVTQTNVRDRKSEVRGRKAEVGSQTSEVGGRNSEFGSRRSEVGTPESARRSPPSGSPSHPPSDVRPPPSHEVRADADFVWALKDVSFEVKRGEVLGIIGRNGAGKSTLLKILSRITAPTSGQIKVKGRIASLLEVGTGMHGELTGRENIYLNGAILGMTKAEITGKLDEIIDFSGCERYIDTPVKRYSSGMMVRLGFAVAAHLEPEILIVDEVLAVGDAEFQRKCIGKMQDVAKGGRTVLFVSHNMASIGELCPSCALLGDGELVTQGRTESVVRGYLASSFSGSGTADIAESQHRTVSPLRITRVTLSNGVEHVASSFLRGEQIRVGLSVTSEEHIGDVVLGIELFTSGACLTQFVSPAMQMTKGACRTYRCELPVCSLVPGFYEVHVGARRESCSVGLDWVPEAIGFQISEAAQGPDSAIPHPRGIVFLQGTWNEVR